MTTYEEKLRLFKEMTNSSFFKRKSSFLKWAKLSGWYWEFGAFSRGFYGKSLYFDIKAYSNTICTHRIQIHSFVPTRIQEIWYSDSATILSNRFSTHYACNTCMHMHTRKHYCANLWSITDGRECAYSFQWEYFQYIFHSLVRIGAVVVVYSIEL